MLPLFPSLILPQNKYFSKHFTFSNVKVRETKERYFIYLS